MIKGRLGSQEVVFEFNVSFVYNTHKKTDYSIKKKKKKKKQ